jgi:hypothetical protein
VRVEAIRVWVARSLRLSLFLLAACSGLLSILLAWSAIPEAGRNPASSDFGWLRSQWLVGFLLATVLIGLAIRLASGRTRALFVALLLINFAVSLVPGYQFCAYQGFPDLGRLIGTGRR